MRNLILRCGLAFPLVLLGLSSWGQSEEDVLRISDIAPGGTARSNGLANAFGAVGADMSAVSINPGALGLYRISELSLTPILEVNDASSLYYGDRTSDERTRFAFSSLALAINSPSESDGDWRSSTYGITFDRQATHNWRRAARADVVPSTILQSFVNEANGSAGADLISYFPFTSGLAWDTYGINPSYLLDGNGDTIPNMYESAIPFGSDVNQEHTIESTGSATNTAFFYSGNYRDQLYIGAALGIVGHRYKRSTVHKETSLNEDLDLRDLSYREELNATGTGVDLKVGIVGRVTERFRLGLSFHSPQWFQMNEVYTTKMRTGFRTPDSQGTSSYSSNSPDGIFSYRVNTPWRGVASAAYVIGSFGIVSMDYTYANFSKARFRRSSSLADDYNFAAENTIINNSFRAVQGLRVGTEWRHNNWYYRMGWGFAPDAYRKEQTRHSESTKTYAGGIGYRTDHFGLDLAVNYIQGGTTFYQYDPSTVEATVEDRRTVRTMVTLSFRP